MKYFSFLVFMSRTGIGRYRELCPYDRSLYDLLTSRWHLGASRPVPTAVPVCLFPVLWNRPTFVYNGILKTIKSCSKFCTTIPKYQLRAPSFGKIESNLRIFSKHFVKKKSQKFNKWGSRGASIPASRVDTQADIVDPPP